MVIATKKIGPRVEFDFVWLHDNALGKSKNPLILPKNASMG